jgi:hypothetical protein
MSSFITLTPHPITITLPGKGSVAQPLWTVVDVSAFDILDLELGMLFVSPKVTANVVIETSMQNQSESPGSGHGDGDWQVAGQFSQPIVGSPSAPPTPQWQRLNIASGVAGNGLLKFVRWHVSLSAAGTVTFFIRGIARRWSR